jgi:hypothetical protein
MIISKVRNFILNKVNAVPKINYKDFKPRNFQPDAYDITKVYHLNKWLLENTPKEKDEFMERSQALDREAFYHNNKLFERRFLIFILLAIYYYNFHFEEHQENRDFERLIDKKREEQPFIDLMQGGYEFGEQ